ncbi:type VI secretion system lipoprotein TssJ [Marinomonas fungiae]|uniref:type VI secretion system lipoprotein TssJ n=1 Tax=Marinomonas fungiae TaxID=1137284 RepID=UPI003A8EB443
MKPILLGSILIGCTLLSGCSMNPFSDAEEEGIKLQFDMSATDTLNPDINGQPSPIEIRVFQLSSTTEFEQADFFDLYQDNPLPSSLLDTRIFIIKPGEKAQVVTDLDLETKFIGVVAGYRDLDHSVWHDVIQVRDERGFLRRLIGSHKRMTLQAEASQNEVSLMDEEE